MKIEDLDAGKFAPEAALVEELLAHPPYDERAAGAISQRALGWVQTLRNNPDERTLLDSFLTEYGLSNEEGIALMCLAEAYLRIPDDESAEELIMEKLAHQDWEEHLGNAESWLVNSSTWALMLTGKLLSLKPGEGPQEWMRQIIDRLGMPVVQVAVKSAMQILGSEFVLGETIERAIANSDRAPGLAYSYDMLGEGARTMAAAERYFDRYLHAIDVVGERRQDSSVSIKLSALHPRYEPLKAARVEAELGERLLKLCQRAKAQNIEVSIDAEEADRLLLSLKLFETALRAPALKDWNGLGLVVQGYGKRAQAVCHWVQRLAEDTGKRIPVRLVKGAYWDAEIKHAQIEGYPGFPVFTRKGNTDAAYLACARILLDSSHLYPQFATHNAHTLSAVVQMASDRDFECQRLHGMGEQMYAVARNELPNLKTRVYAPVGEHKDLLAYLVRRLLENGANSSFINRLNDDELPLADLVQDPFVRIAENASPTHPSIRTPDRLFADRKNSAGVDLSQAASLAMVLPSTALADDSENTNRTHRIAGDAPLMSPADLSMTISDGATFDPAHVDHAFERALSAQRHWAERPVHERSALIEQFADSLEAARQTLVSLLCHEAGKTLTDAIGEVREAVDFCRYYAAEARHHGTFRELPGPTGEINEIRLRPRGVFVCISPWNFPVAIFTGQIVAALATGNAALAKPAESTPRIAERVLALMHESGIPTDLCQVLPGGAEVGSALVAHDACAGVAFTGSTAVARIINQTLAQRPGAIVPLIAETGGQNAMIVDSTALLEQVTDDVITSAFQSAGQRCSALRVLCIQDEIADPLLDSIRGAMAELKIGHPAAADTDIGPIITASARSRLAAHVERAREDSFPVFELPVPEDLNGHYFPPTLIEIDDVAWLEEECFGPVLHVVRYASADLPALMEAINATGYALTFGIHSRLNQRAETLAGTTLAGNVYINRNMIGAVVGSQPFGGRGLSGTGPKAGGPNYLPRFCVEQTVTRNTAAVGGNVTLLSE